MPVSWSVIITTRNRAKMLRRAIVSCLNQTYECEIIVVDEASSDETPAVVKEFPAVRYLRNEMPLGHSAAANLGIKAAAGEWIKPLDDDDWLAPDCIEVFTRALDAARVSGFSPSVISGGAINVDEQEHESGRSRSISDMAVALDSKNLLHLMMLDQAPIGTPVQVGHRRDTALEVGGWNEQRLVAHQHGDEAELWIKLATRGDAVFIPDVVAYRTIWTGGSQLGIPHEQRYKSNVLLKDQIASALGQQTPPVIKSYLGLHWALVAAKEKNFGATLKLGAEWIKRPWSIAYFLQRRSLAKAQELVKPITQFSRG